MKFIDMKGLKYGRLTVLNYLGRKKGHSIWVCVCECGNIKKVDGMHLRYGRVVSCGCKKKEGTHKLTKTTTYNVWDAMIQRCTNIKNNSYKNYGGRGISVCDRWLNFENFLNDMGARPAGHQIDRIDNDGNYEPSNCRWATRTENNRHTRRSRFYEFNGKRQCLQAWADELNITATALYGRIVKMGWSIDKAFSTPLKKTTSEAA